MQTDVREGMLSAKSKYLKLYNVFRKKDFKSEPSQELIRHN